MKRNTIRIALGLLSLLASAACTPNATDFLQTAGYDASGARTGSVLPSSTMLTPY